MPQSNGKTAKAPKLSIWAKGSFDMPFALIVMGLLTIGLIMMYSASYTYSFYQSGDSAGMIKKQLIFAVIGIAAMFFVSKINYQLIRIFVIPVFAVAIALLLIVLVLPEYKPGFHRWIDLGFTTFQPSEIAKFALILFCAWGMEKHNSVITGRAKLNSQWVKNLRAKTGNENIQIGSLIMTMFYGGVVVVTAGLVYAENHVSGTVLMLAIGVVMLYLGEFNRWWFVIGLAVAAVAVVFFIIKPEILEEYAGERIVAWLDKTYEPRGARWQIDNSIYAIGSGGFWGVGLGNSKQKHMYVSEPQNDFIFAIVTEELGFIGSALVLILFALLVWRGVVIGMRAKDRFGSMLAMGIVFQVGLQTVLNIAVVTDSIPNTGISLPFFSYGGTSLTMLLFEMGIVLAISRYSNVAKIPREKAAVKK